MRVILWAIRIDEERCCIITFISQRFGQWTAAPSPRHEISILMCPLLDIAIISFSNQHYKTEKRFSCPMVTYSLQEPLKNAFAVNFLYIWSYFLCFPANQPSGSDNVCCIITHIGFIRTSSSITPFFQKWSCIIDQGIVEQWGHKTWNPCIAKNRNPNKRLPPLSIRESTVICKRFQIKKSYYTVGWPTELVLSS